MERKKLSFNNLFSKGLTSHEGMKLNPFTLSFTGEQKIYEHQFLNDYHKKSLVQFRFSMILALLLYDVFALLDATIAPDLYKVLWIIRFALATPALIIAYLLSYTKAFVKYMQLYVAITWLITGVGIIIMNHLITAQGIYSYYAGLILIFIFGYTFIRARFIYTIVVGWLLVILYMISAIWMSEIPISYLYSNNFFLIATSLIGLFINYTLETNHRRDFFFRRLLIEEQEKVKAANHALEKRVRERTAQLTNANIELNKEIEQRKQYEEERNKIEMQLLQLQKMETIGTLAGGIAHDFNNILTPILGYTEMAMEELEEESNLMYDIEQIYNAAMRAKDLVQQILTFSRQMEVDKRPLPMDQLINEVMNLVKASFPSNIQIIKNLSPDCGTIMADSTQIHQVIMNLSTNAYHAMKEKGGTLKISLKTVRANKAMQRKIPKLELKTYLCTTVSDTGHGMDKVTLSRIFEPFFTKKEVGVGSGLGLSVVHGIVSSYDGAITVESEPGKGTVFNIYLPQYSAADNIKLNKDRIVQKGKEHILFVDDEEEITFMGKRMLESLGYTVNVHTNSLAALDDFTSDPTLYDLLVTDQTMPYMLGTELIRKARELKPAIKAIIITGFGDSITEEEKIKKGIDAIVVKPLILSSFSNLIRKVLDNN